MTFYERYEKVCIQHGIDPCSQKAADLIHTTRGNISMWKKNNTTPKGEMLCAIADAYHVSTDYLVGRTDDQTDYTSPKAKLTIAPSTAPSTAGTNDAVIAKYNQLDETDKMKAEAYIDGILSADKYRRKLQA